MHNPKHWILHRLEDLYHFVANEEDARVCKDIPPEACADQPRNFFGYLVANLLGKIADEISSAKLVLPWIFSAIGVPALFTGFLVPIRESGKLLPQLAVAAWLRNLPIRKYVWVTGSLISCLSLIGMGCATLLLRGSIAGSTIIALLILFSLAQGLCSVAAKDVLGKTVSKTRRGRLMGWSVSISGIAILAIGLWMSTTQLQDAGVKVYSALLILGGLIWGLGAIAFASIREQPGATEGGGNALTTAVRQLKMLATDRDFRRFVTARSLLLAIALAPPFYVLIAQSLSQDALLGLGSLIIANGLAASLSAPFWGYWGDYSSRNVMATAAMGAGFLGILTFLAVVLQWQWITGELGIALIFFLLNMLHSGVRLGRKIYLVDMGNRENRAAYVAISNTIIGVLMLAGGIIGWIGGIIGAAATVLLLGLASLFAAAYTLTLPDVSKD